MDSKKFREDDIRSILRKNQTLAEKALWDNLRAKKLKGVKFRRQHSLKGYVVDFYSYKLNLIIEVDGSIHDNNQLKDKFRQKELMAKTGGSFLRFTNEEILYRMEYVLETISAFIAEKKSHPFNPK